MNPLDPASDYARDSKPAIDPGGRDTYHDDVPDADLANFTGAATGEQEGGRLADD